MNIVSRVWQISDVIIPVDDMFQDGSNRTMCHGFVIWRNGTMQRFGGDVISRDMLHNKLHEMCDMIEYDVIVKPQSEWRYRVCSMQLSMPCVTDVMKFVSRMTSYCGSVYHKPKTGLHAYRFVLPNDLGTMLVYDSGSVTLFCKDYDRARYVCDMMENYM